MEQFDTLPIHCRHIEHMQEGVWSKKKKRGVCICAHAWIFFELCILITHYIQTTKMHLSGKIVKNKA